MYEIRFYHGIDKKQDTIHNFNDRNEAINYFFEQLMKAATYGFGALLMINSENDETIQIYMNQDFCRIDKLYKNNWKSA